MSTSVEGNIERKELKAQWPAEKTNVQYTKKQVAEHNTKGDVWIAIHGRVYDITSYLQDHPGGAESLLEVAGTDATTAYEDVGHSEDAREIMESYLQGVLKDGDQTSRPQPVRVISRTQDVKAKPDNSKFLLKAGIATTVTVGATGLVLGLYSKMPNMGSHQLRVSVPFLSKVGNISLLKGGNENGFLKGFLVAAALSGAIGLAVIDHITKAASITSGFLRYPPHMKAPKIPVRHPAGFLAPGTYKKLTLVKREILGNDLVKLVYELPTPDTVLGLPIGQHVAIKARVGDHFVTRSYTPISNNSDKGRLELVLRIYPDGLLTGGYLSKLDIGDETEFRGPKGAMRYRKGWASKIGMIAGGTGITPMYQLIRAICEDDTDTTEISLVYANRSEGDILLRQELERFARSYPKNLKIWFMLDSPSDTWKYGSGYISKEVLSERMPAPSTDSSTKVLLCGPPGMVNASKKNLVELSWKAPGAVSKMSDDIFCF